MVWQEERGAPSIYRCTWVLWCCHVATFPLFFIKIFSSLSNYANYLILENSYLAMKHENSSLLLFPNYSRTFSSMHYYFQHLCNSASMKDYVRLICGACTHWRQLEDMFYELVCVDFFMSDNILIHCKICGCRRPLQEMRPYVTNMSLSLVIEASSLKTCDNFLWQFVICDNFLWQLQLSQIRNCHKNSL